jgi:hypothetical protein
MHLNDGQIQRLMHDELDASSRDAALGHIAECPSCEEALADAKREEAAIFDLLGHVDHAAPKVNAARFIGPGRTPSPAWARRAAGIVIVAALAGAAYAIPGSPLPGLVKKTRRARERTRSARGRRCGQTGTTGDLRIAVPAGDGFIIQFATTQDSSYAIVSFTPDAMVRVRAIGGTAVFTTDTGRLDIDNRGSTAHYEIEIPAQLPGAGVKIQIDNILAFQRGADYSTMRGREIAPGRYRIFPSLARNGSS